MSDLGTDGTLSVPTMTSFFAHQQFPANNWHRRATPGDFSLIGTAAGTIENAHPVPPGSNINGVYVPDNLTVSAVSSSYFHRSPSLIIGYEGLWTLQQSR